MDEKPGLIMSLLLRIAGEDPSPPVSKAVRHRAFIIGMLIMISAGFSGMAIFLFVMRTSGNPWLSLGMSFIDFVFICLLEAGLYLVTSGFRRVLMMLIRIVGIGCIAYMTSRPLQLALIKDYLKGKSAQHTAQLNAEAYTPVLKEAAEYEAKKTAVTLEIAKKQQELEAKRGQLRTARNAQDSSYIRHLASKLEKQIAKTEDKLRQTEVDHVREHTFLESKSQLNKLQPGTSFIDDMIQCERLSFSGDPVERKVVRQVQLGITALFFFIELFPCLIASCMPKTAGETERETQERLQITNTEYYAEVQNERMKRLRDLAINGEDQALDQAARTLRGIKVELKTD